MPPIQRHRPIQVRLPEWGVFVAESVHASDFSPHRMRHDYLKVIYVLRGEGVLHWSGTSRTCRAGDVVVMPIGQEHMVHDAPTLPMALYIVCIGPWLIDHDRQLVSDLSRVLVVRDAVVSETVRTTLRRMLYEGAARQRGCKSMLQGLALQLLAQVARRLPAESEQATPPDCRAVVKQYLRQLESNFFEPTNLDAVARRLGISRRRLTQLCRELTGDSWVHYVQRQRVEHAKHLLTTTDRTILAIAFECGFRDPSTFYRAFQRHAERSPHAWRMAAGRSA